MRSGLERVIAEELRRRADRRQVVRIERLLWHVNVVGEWDEDPTAIRFSDVTSMSFQDRYAEMVVKYARSPL
jgi:hypothetical protein